MAVDYSKLSDEELDRLLSAESETPDYSKLSDEELDKALSALESPMPKKEQVQKMSKAESALQGAGQGATLGFGDELSGAAGYLAGKLGLTPDMGYEYYRDYARNQAKEASAANPYTYGAGQIAGGIATSAIPGLGAAGSFKGAVGTGAALGGASGVGASEANLLSSQTLQDAALGAGLGGALGGVSQKLANYLTGAKPVTENLNKIADKLAEKATGATAAQAERFSPGAGRILREQGLVRFGDSPANIAERVAAAERTSGINIGEAINKLNDQGVTISRLNVIKNLQNEIDNLAQYDGTAPIRKQLTKQIKELSKDILSEEKLTAPIAKGEAAKKNFQGLTNYFSPEAEKSATGTVARLFKDEVERAATLADPELASQFIKDKQLFSVLRPIKEAAERRATQLNQSPFGGIGDAMTAAAAGKYGPWDMVKAVVGRRLLAPRLSSSMSAATGATANVLEGINNALGQSAPAVADALQVAGRSAAVSELLNKIHSKNPKKSAADIIRDLEKTKSKSKESSPWTTMLKKGS